MTDKSCKNCGGSGWTSYEVPGAMVGGILHMRERITPCHLCNAGGSWKRWAQNVIGGDGELRKEEKP